MTLFFVLFFILSWMQCIESRKMQSVSYTSLPQLPVEKEKRGNFFGRILSKAPSVNNAQSLGAFACYSYVGFRVIRALWDWVRPVERWAILTGRGGDLGVEGAKSIKWTPGRGSGSGSVWGATSLQSLSRDQEELWRVVDELVSAREKSLSSHISLSNELHNATDAITSTTEDCRGDMAVLKLAMSELSDRMMEVEGLKEQIDEATSLAQSASDRMMEVEGLKEQIDEATALAQSVSDRMMEVEGLKEQIDEATALAQSASDSSIKSSEGLADLAGSKDELLETMRAELSSRTEKLTESLAELRSGLPAILKRHDAAIAGRLKTYGEEVRAAVRSGTTTTDAAAVPTPSTTPRSRSRSSRN
jgi:hypothetical protein